MVALYDYTAQGPEDLEFSEGNTIDILGEGEALQFVAHLCGTELHFPFVLSTSQKSLTGCMLFPVTFAVNEEWLEGHCAGKIGIFPSCFAYRENDNIMQNSDS